MDGVISRMCKVLIVKLLLLKELLTFFNACKLQKLFMKMLYNLLILKRILDKMLTVLITSVKIEYNSPHQKFPSMWVNTLESARKVV